jgi:hypothetical protein
MSSSSTTTITAITTVEPSFRTLREPTTLAGRLAFLQLALWSHKSPLFLPTIGHGGDADREYYITRQKEYCSLFSKDQRDWAKREWCRARRWWVNARYEADGKTLRPEARREEAQEQQEDVRRDSAYAVAERMEEDEEYWSIVATVDYDSA